MKTTNYIILLGLLLTSCLDRFEPNTASFNKVYSHNLEAILSGVIATNDNGFLLYGHMDKSIQSAPFSTGSLGTLLKTDARGNEIWRRSFRIDSVSVENHPIFFGTSWAVSDLYFANIIQLENGNYFAAVTLVLPDLLNYFAPCYIIFDQRTGAIIEYDTFFDNVVDPGYLGNELIVRDRPQVFKVPGSTDILVVLGRSWLLETTNFNIISNDFTSIFRLRANDYKNPIWVQDYTNNLADDNDFHDLAFDLDGKIIFIGSAVENNVGQCSQTFIKKIVSESGALIGHNPLTPFDEIHHPFTIISFLDGYAVQEMRNPPNQLCRWKAPNNPNAENIGGIRLVSSDLSSHTLIYSTISEMSRGVVKALIETSDNALVSGFRLSSELQEGTFISKIDASGKLIWEYRDPHLELSDGIYETPDGGIVFGSTASYGGTNKWSLTKLTRDGKL